MNTNTAEKATVIFDSYDYCFGACSLCKSTEYVDVGCDHYGFCRAHKIKWCIGANLFSSWRHQTPEERAQAVELLAPYAEVPMADCIFLNQQTGLLGG